MVMPSETLLSAARRAVRFFNIDNTRGGGLISNETSSAMETLDRQWRLEEERQKKAEDRSADLHVIS